MADIFENFHDSLRRELLDPAYYYTLPGFTWDAMLKHTDVKFEPFIDIDMVMFIKRDIGGLSQCANRYAQVNNKYAVIQSIEIVIVLDVSNVWLGNVSIMP